MAAVEKVMRAVAIALIGCDGVGAGNAGFLGPLGARAGASFRGAARQQWTGWCSRNRMGT